MSSESRPPQPSSLFVSWQDADSRQWFVVGKLTITPAGSYIFQYTRGAREAQRHHFRTLPGFPELTQRYEQSRLFATFQNRLPPASRPDYADFLTWLDVSPATDAPDPLLILDRTSGTRQTDSIELFRRPTPAPDGTLDISFFVRGLRYRTEPVRDHIDHHLPAGTRLLMTLDVQNPRDSHAVLLRTEHDMYALGYLPRHLRTLARELIQRNPDTAEVTVERVNLPPAPQQLRLLCRFSARNIPAHLPALQDSAFEPYG